MYVRTASIVALGLIAVGCSSSSGSQGASDSPTPTGTIATPTATPTPNPPGTGVGPGGGTVSDLRFAIVGDTRPSLPDGLASYPTAVITKIYQDLDVEMPKPAFGISTGDYILADPWTDEGAEQIDTYLTAREGFSQQMFYAMGNHECITLTSGNCLASNVGGIPNSMKHFLDKMVYPLGYQHPYYAFDVDAADGSWTSKFVLIAANSWDSTQAAWLNSVLSEPTTYTFVIRHENYAATDAPGTTPSEQIIAAHPYTLKLVGHNHTYQWEPDAHEVITGNGGAPLTGSIDYGYTIVDRLPNGDIEGHNYDYQTHAQIGAAFEVQADGTVVF